MPYNRLYNGLAPSEPQSMSDLANALVAIHERKLERARRQVMDEAALAEQKQRMQAEQLRQQLAEYGVAQSAHEAATVPPPAPSATDQTDISNEVPTPGATPVYTQPQLDAYRAAPIGQGAAAAAAPPKTFSFTFPSTGTTVDLPLIPYAEKQRQLAEELKRAGIFSGRIMEAPGQTPSGVVPEQVGVAALRPDKVENPEPVVIDGKETMATPSQIIAATAAGRKVTPFHPQSTSLQPFLVNIGGTPTLIDKRTRQPIPGVEPADTTEMRNRAAGRVLAFKSIDLVQNLSKKIITRVGPKQRLEAVKRGVEAVFGSDPDFRTYQDARMALAGNLAVAQQGSRPSDADVRAIWLPIVPDAYRDTADSAKEKWNMIKVMSGGTAEPDTVDTEVPGVRKRVKVP